jgi:hypothetical protein
MDPVFVQALRTAFASHYAFLIKVQDAHWNVQSCDFYEAHLLFERIYQEVEEAVDPFAENLRKCQVFVPAGLSKMRELSVISDMPSEDIVDVDVYYQLLLDDTVALADLFAAAFDLAETNKEHGLSNFFADRQDAMRGHAWMLRMQLIPEPNETS